mmetsp:Transcript_101483/g.264638  ORF Transcript_101483/g.264638 Transcript_101483/m.264638 type:complete len:237 (-) Transcript_101483:58-768(-)
MARRGGRGAGCALLLLGPAWWCLAACGCAFVPPGRGRQPLAQTRQLSVERGFFDAFNQGTQPPPEPPVVIKEDYRMAGILAALGVVLSAALPFAGLGLGGLCLLLGVLFFVQAGRVRFVFDETSFSLRTKSGEDDLTDPGQNIVVGGENRWKYSSFVNYEFFPKGLVEQGLPPVLVYFKETQTPEAEWGVGPGEFANSEEAIAKGAVPGMVHFFPAICDAQQIRAEFERRGCKKIS